MIDHISNRIPGGYELAVDQLYSEPRLFLGILHFNL